MLEVRRRRGRGFGSSAAEHRTRAEGWRVDTENNANAVHHHVANDACSSAVNETRHMNTNYGRYLAETRGAGKAPGSSVTAAVVTAAMDAVKRHCIR